MITVEDSIAISRPPSEVFAFVADLSNIPKWQSEVVTSKVLTAGPTKVGTRFTEDVKMGSRHTTATCEVVEFKPGSMMAFSAVSPAMDYQGRISVAGSNGGTKLTIAAAARLKGWWRLMQPMMRGEFRNGIRKELETLKTIMEAGRP